MAVPESDDRKRGAVGIEEAWETGKRHSPLARNIALTWTAALSGTAASTYPSTYSETLAGDRNGV